MLRKLFPALALLTVCAPCARAQEIALSPDQLSLVRETCAQVMGLKPGETYFAVCQQNLSQALPPNSHPLAIAAAATDRSFYEVSPMARWNREEEACIRIGLRPGSTLFHQCAAGLDSAFLPSPN